MIVVEGGMEYRFFGGFFSGRVVFYVFFRVFSFFCLLFGYSRFLGLDGICSGRLLGKFL